MSTTCHWNNQDTNIPTVMAISSMDIIPILCVLLLKLLLITDINRKKLPFTCFTQERAEKYHFVVFRFRQK